MIASAATSLAIKRCRCFRVIPSRPSTAALRRCFSSGAPLLPDEPFRGNHNDEYPDDYQNGGKTFQEKWIGFFDSSLDLFEVQRGLNNLFGYDIIPPGNVLEAAIRACRRHNSFSTAVRIFGGLRNKPIDIYQYSEMVAYLRPLMDELGVCIPEELGRHDRV